MNPRPQAWISADAATGTVRNMKELERHLDVSYPTTRCRFDAVPSRMGIEAPVPALEEMG